MLGSDNVGSLRAYVPAIRAHDGLLAALDDEGVIRKLASEDFIRLMPECGVTLEAGYQYPEDKYIPGGEPVMAQGWGARGLAATPLPR